MRTHYFIGRIHPERYNWTLPTLEYRFEAASGAPADGYCLTISVEHSQVGVRFDTDSDENPMTLKNVAVDIARGHIDALGFIVGAALQVEIQTYLDPGGAVHTLNTAFDGTIDEPGFTEGDQISLSKASVALPGLRTAIADVRSAIASPSDTVFHAFRAVEAIRQSYVNGNDEGAARKQSWVDLREATGVTEDDLRWLMDPAIPRRHGADVYQTEETRRRSIRIARAAIIGHAKSSGYLTGGPESDISRIPVPST